MIESNRTESLRERRRHGWRLGLVVGMGSACVLVLAGGARADFVSPVDEVSLKWCIGGATDPTIHLLGLTDGCRNARVDSGAWTDHLRAAPGDTVQLDLFLKLNDVGLAAYAISVGFDTEGEDVLDYEAMSLYNLRQFYSPFQAIQCAPLGDAGVADGGCEEMTGSGLNAYRGVRVHRADRAVIEREVLQFRPIHSEDPLATVDSELGAPGWVYNMSALSLDLLPIQGNASGVDVRVGSLWFEVNEDGTISSQNPGLHRMPVDFLLTTSNDGLFAPDDWLSALVWSGTTLEVGPMQVEIDIKPGRDDNHIYPRFAHLPIPVLLLGSEDFDVTTVDPESLEFGPGGGEPIEAHEITQLQDWNDDGYLDWLTLYRTAETGIVEGDEEACLRGRTLGSESVEGTDFEGCDSVIVGPLCGLGAELALLLPPLVWLRRQVRRRR